jgi:hypothetical protein
VKSDTALRAQRWRTRDGGVNEFGGVGEAVRRAAEAQKGLVKRIAGVPPGPRCPSVCRATEK